MQVIPSNIQRVISEFTNKVTKILGKHLKQIILMMEKQ